MRIGLLTHHWVCNFGANLQALATFSFLNALGHETIFLNYRPPRLETAARQKIRPDQAEAHERHCNVFFRQSPVLHTDNDIAAFCSIMKPDAIVAGSDSLIRIKGSVHTEDGSFPNAFWLTWMNGNLDPRPRCGFLAVSAEGSFYWFLSEAKKAGVRQAFSSLDYVSVRDRWSRYMVKWVTNGRVIPRLCPDPVSVLNDVFTIPTVYEQEAASLHGKYVLLSASPRYFSRHWVKEFTRIAHGTGLQVFTLPLPEHEISLEVDRVLALPMDPLTWYSWIRHAKGIVAERFHSIACCVFNNVPFVSIDVSGPMWFHGLAIRRASKAHDICLNVDARSRSFLPLYARLLLSPMRTMELLMDWDPQICADYQVQARDTFAQTVHELLHGCGRPDSH